MPAVLAFLCYLIAFLCFLAAAFAHERPWATRVNILALGLALWVAVPLWSAAEHLD